MSALNVIVTSDSVAVLTDGAAYQIQDGRPVLVHLAHKVALLPLQRAALAFRGIAGILAMVPAMTIHADTFDGLVDGLTERVRSSLAALEKHTGLLPVADIVLAGWSERDDEPQAWMVANVDRPGQPAWSLVRLYGLQAPPVPHMPLQHGMDPETDGLAIMRAQREITDVEGEPVMAGGFCQLTSVYRDRITTEILERWPEDVELRPAA